MAYHFIYKYYIDYKEVWGGEGKEGNMSSLLRHRNQISNATFKKYKVYLRLFLRNGFVLNDFTIDANSKINSLKGKNGNSLNISYKLSISLFIKKVVRNTDVRPNEFQSMPMPLQNSTSNLDCAKQLIHQASDYMKQVLKDESINIYIYEPYIAMLFSFSTCLRINEIMNLKMKHLDLMEQSEMIPIKTKTSNTPIPIPLNHILNALISWIKKTRNAYIKVLAQQHVKFIEDKRNIRYKNDFIILHSESFVRKCLTKISKTPHISFNTFRKCITSHLVVKGAHRLAMRMNRHRKLDTTLQYYAVRTNDTLEKMYSEKIFKFG